jgi:hypothetical protein
VVKKLAIFMVFIVVLGAAIGTTVWLVKRNKAIDAPDIALGERYYLSAMRNALFRETDETGMLNRDENGLPTNPLLEMKTRDRSYGVFENDFKTFTIYFWDGANGYRDFPFVLTKVKRPKGGIKATIKHIYDANIYTFEITANANSIKLDTVSVTRVTIATKEYVPAPVEEVYREKTVVLEFARNKPEYLRGIV